MNPAQRKYAAWVAEDGCTICRKPAEAHHEPYGRGRKDHRYLVALCVYHHKDGTAGRHHIKLERFNRLYKMDIRQLAKDNWDEYQSYQEDAL